MRHFGSIPGVTTGAVYNNRADLAAAGISGSGEEGADSIVLSGGYEDDEDYGDQKEYYGADGGWTWSWEPHTLRVVWSEDKGKTWNWTEPLTEPGRGGYGEAERHLIGLPSGRLLMAANCANALGTLAPICTVIHSSDDNGTRGYFWRFCPNTWRSPAASRRCCTPAAGALFCWRAAKPLARTATSPNARC